MEKTNLMPGKKSFNTRTIALDPPNKKEVAVVVSQKALEKMRAFVYTCNKEVGWLGFVNRVDDEKNILLEIVDVVLLNQQSNGATCEILPGSISEYSLQLLDLPNGVDLCNSLRFWGHSHVDMGIGESSQDSQQLEDMAKRSGWFLSAILNKSGDMGFTFRDEENRLLYKEVPWYYKSQYLEFAEKEVFEKVMDIPIPINNQYNQYNQYFRNRTDVSNHIDRVYGHQPKNTKNPKNTRNPKNNKHANHVVKSDTKSICVEINRTAAQIKSIVDTFFTHTDILVIVDSDLATSKEIIEEILSNHMDIDKEQLCSLSDEIYHYIIHSFISEDL